MILFFDTSALVKFFHNEDGTEAVTDLLNSQENKIWISERKRHHHETEKGKVKYFSVQLEV